MDMSQYFRALSHTLLIQIFATSLFHNFPKTGHIFVTYNSCPETSNVWKA